MPPHKTQITCPQCGQPVVAIVEQLFDVSADPAAKQRLLGGVSNVAACRNCGFSGPLATPIVYHDADKELLLTYFPPELNLPLNEQEKIVGPLITQVTNRLPPEKRKAYLLRPQNFLTYQSLIERILNADGITSEMIKAQQQKLALIERLLTAPSAEVRSEIIRSESQAFDQEFFALFSRLLQSSAGQENLARQMEAIQTQLLAETEYGKTLMNQVSEMQAAVKTLQDAGKQLDREKLLDIMIEAPSDERLNALVSLTRPALDYLFFQSLTNRIEAHAGAERQKLENLREKLLAITSRIDQAIEEQYRQAGELLQTILSADNIEDAMLAHLDEIDDVFVRVLNQAMQAALKANDEEKKKKLQAVIAALQKVSAPPPELSLLEELLECENEAELEKRLEAHAAEITPEFAGFVSGLLARSQERAGETPVSEEAQALARLEAINRAVLKFSMKRNLNA
ncbi:MAG: CpXC domain-containing protein [Anaerolineales bacterium]